MAGAKTAIMSLWKVDDTATRVLMTDFYSNLWEKKVGKLESLRPAQLAMIHRHDPRTRKLTARGLDLPDAPRDAQRSAPYYWAAFVLSGDWR
jgi:CHAT domain-containing protein